MKEQNIRMYKNKIQWFLVLCFIVCNHIFFAQEIRDIDSLKQKIAISTGENKSRYLQVLSSKYPPGDTATTFPLMRESFKAAKSVNFQQGISQYFFARARALSAMGKDKIAKEILNESFQYIDTLKPNSAWGSCYITLGGIYSDVSDGSNASSAYLTALKIFDKINDTLGIARAAHGLGVIQQDAGNIDAAEKYYLKAMKYYGMANLKDKQATMFANIGGLFLSRAMQTKNEDDYTKAKDYLNKGLSLAMKIKDYQVMGNSYNNLASLYGSKNDLDVCLEYNFKGLEVRKRNGLKFGVASSLGNIATVYHMKGRDDLAEKYLLEAIAIGEEIKALRHLANDYELLSDVYLSQKKFESSLKYYRLSKNILDSINNADKISAMSELEKKYDTEKKDAEIELLNQTQQANDAEIARQKILNYAIGIGLALVIIFSFYILRSNRERKKANDELLLKNNIIEEKNKNITDSINYAKRIQDAMLPDWETGNKLFPEAFILFKPRDIVSGDFYWFTEKSGRRLIAAVDCTGHGVPGAFMSMIGNAFLNEVVNERGIVEPGMILSELRHLVIKALKQKGAGGEQRDGMDISLLSLSADNKTIDWAGANNPLWIIRDGKIIEHKPDKRPIGFFMGKGLPFKNHTIDLQKGDVLYIFTDGYADQFGGNKEGGKKFKLSRLKTLLLSLQDQSMDIQNKKLEQTITEWRGNLEQVDDICIIGIKI